MADLTSRHRRNAVRAALWLLVLCNIAMIFYFSSQPDESSAQTSMGVTQAVLQVTVPEYGAMQPDAQRRMITALHPSVRNAAHAAEFSLLGFLLMLALSRYPLPVPRRLFLAAGAALFVAALDEAFQSRVPGRSASFADFGLDALGVAFGIALSFVFRPQARLSAKSKETKQKA